MVLDDKSPQLPTQVGLPTSSRGEAPMACRSEEAPSVKQEDERSGASGLMERVVTRANLLAALKRVEQNKGSAGVDGMSVGDLRAHIVDAWPRIREELLAGRYHPLERDLN